MLYNHGWEKQQTQRPKGLDQKGSGRQRNPPKEILPRVKRTISKAYGWTKNLYTQTRIGAKELNYVNFLQTGRAVMIWMLPLKSHRAFITFNFFVQLGGVTCNNKKQKML